MMRYRLLWMTHSFDAVLSPPEFFLSFVELIKTDKDKNGLMVFNKNQYDEKTSDNTVQNENVPARDIIRL